MSNSQKQAKAALERALEIAGGPTGLSAALKTRKVKITSQAISQWEQVPVGRVLDVEAVSGVQRHDLRPDIYPAPAEV